MRQKNTLKNEKPIIPLIIGGALLGTLYTPVGPIIGAVIGGILASKMDEPKNRTKKRSNKGNGIKL